MRNWIPEASRILPTTSAARSIDMGRSLGRSAPASGRVQLFARTPGQLIGVAQTINTFPAYTSAVADTQHAPVFSAGGRVFTWADVVSAARARGDWPELQRGLGRLLACEHELARADALPSAAEIRSAAAEFRHRRNLLSADELTQWLHGNDVTVAEWTGEIRRTLLAPACEASAVDERASWVHAVCSGRLGGYAWRLAEEVAVLLSTGASLDEDEQ